MAHFNLFLGLGFLVLTSSALGVFCDIKEDYITADYNGRNYTFLPWMEKKFSKCTASDELAAYYTGSHFIVFRGKDQKFKGFRAEKNNPHTVISASSDIASIYDGKIWSIWDDVQERYTWRLPVKDYKNAKISTGLHLATLYDGAYINIFDALNNRDLAVKTHGEPMLVTGSGLMGAYFDNYLWFYDVKTPGALRIFWKYYRGESPVQSLKAVPGVPYVAAYDGKEFKVYDGDTKHLRRFTVEPTCKDPKISIGADGFLIYDCKSIHTFCRDTKHSNSFNARFFRVENQYATSLDIPSGAARLQIGDASVTLNKDNWRCWIDVK